MPASRSKNAILNIVVGWGTQVAILILTFVSRRIFVKFLSTDYLGINGLYSNILSVLALAELGLGNITQYFLYKPVLENDYKKINATVKYFRRLYTFIALGVFSIGLALIPCLRYIINSDLKQNELIIYYIIFLVNSCVTYFAADKIALLAANQDNRLTKYITLTLNIALQFAHIAVLYIWHNYIIYLLATLASTILNVVITQIICHRRYPYLKEKVANHELFDKKIIVNSIKSTFVYKIGATVINNTDNILISTIVSTAAVGLYSNYYAVISAIQGFLSIITTSLISAIGNLSAEGSTKRSYEIFNLVILFYNFVAAFCGVSFFFLLNDFIPIWLGEKYLLDQWTVFAISFSFYLTNAVSPVWMFREANGLFSKVKYLLLTTAAFNMVFSIILGNLFGTFGILFATSLARIVTTVWYEPKILFKNVFEKSCIAYWFKQTKYIVLAVIGTTVCFVINYFLPHSFIFIIVKGLSFFAIFVMVFSIFCIKDQEFKEVKNIILRFTKKIKHGRG